MIVRTIATARIESNIARRNRWVLITVLLMVVFSLVLSAAGSAPTGALGAERLSPRCRSTSCRSWPCSCPSTPWRAKSNAARCPCC